MEIEQCMFKERANRFICELSRPDLSEQERERLRESLKKLQNAASRRGRAALLVYSSGK